MCGGESMGEMFGEIARKCRKLNQNCNANPDVSLKIKAG